MADLEEAFNLVAYSLLILHQKLAISFSLLKEKNDFFVNWPPDCRKSLPFKRCHYSSESFIACFRFQDSSAVIHQKVMRKMPGNWPPLPPSPDHTHLIFAWLLSESLS